MCRDFFSYPVLCGVWGGDTLAAKRAFFIVLLFLVTSALGLPWLGLVMQNGLLSSLRGRLDDGPGVCF